MAIITVWYADGTTDRFGTEGGETDAMAQELAEDDEVDDYQIDYDAPAEG